MYLGTIAEAERVFPLHPKLEQLFSYVRTHDFLFFPLGCAVLESETLFINHSEIVLCPPHKVALEIHRRYLDVHIPLNGVEMIGYKAARNLSVASREPFDEAKDLAFYDEQPTTYVRVFPGEFLLIFPEDGHAPMIGEGSLRKLVAKIRI